MINTKLLIKLLKKDNKTLRGNSIIKISRKTRHYIVNSFEDFLINSNKFNNHDIMVNLLKLNTQLTKKNITLIEACDIIQDSINNCNKIKLDKFSKEEKYNLQKIIYVTNLIKDNKDKYIEEVFIHLFINKL